MRIIENRLTSGKDRSAALVLSLSDENKKTLFSKLKEREIWTLSASMSNLGVIEPAVIKNVLMDFLHLMREGSAVTGSFDGTKEMLEKLLGKDKASSVLDGVSGDDDGVWEQLSEVNIEMLAQFLQKEDPQTVSVILSRIAPQRSANVLDVYDKDFSVGILMRILKAAPIKGVVLSEIQNFLKTEFMEEFKRGGDVFDSHKVVAEILNAFDQQTSDNFLDVLDKEVPESAARVRSLMFTFQDMLRIDRSDMQKIIAAVDKSDLAMALKGATKAIKDLFFNNMSERAGKLLQDDMDSLGSVRLSDVEKAQREMLSITKQMQRDGEITIPEAGEDKSMVS